MTSREFSEVDHDLLADYLGGALDGTPEQATVARLVEQDPAWGEAYAVLARAVELVQADLAIWAAEPVPELPPTVADRLDAALAGAGPPAAVLTAEAAEQNAAPAVVPAQPGRGTHPAGGTDRPGRNTGPGRRSRRWARLAGPVALAAASVTAVGFGVSYLVDAGSGRITEAGGNAGSGADRDAAPLAAAPFRTTGPARHSGTDYTPEGLTRQPAVFGAPSPSAGGGKGDTSGSEDEHRVGIGATLGRLAGPEALASCLSAIGDEHGAGPLTVDLVDYARFQGSPALVVTFTDAGGARWAWVTGPECGVPGSGADTRFTTRVG